MGVTEEGSAGRSLATAEVAERALNESGSQSQGSYPLKSRIINPNPNGNVVEKVTLGTIP